MLVAVAVAVVAGGLSEDALPGSATGSGLVATETPSRDIKGNISINRGERIYHVLGQRRYDETIIRPTYGER